MNIHLTRSYLLSASHRLHNPAFSEADNRRLYGKCSNPYGHGHNYVLEVTVSGTPDSATGMVTNLADLDGYVQREVLDAFDHRYLNEELPLFREKVATTENVCVEIHRRLRSFPHARLERIRIEETSLNSFEYLGEPLENLP